MQEQPIIAIMNEKGGTGKTTTAVSLSAALAELGQKVLLVDLDGQAATSRWLGVEEDSRLADALLAGNGLEPIRDVLDGLSLVPASGKLDSVSHELRPTQGGRLRKLLAEQTGFDFIFIDCPPSLGNRLIGNALLAASHVLVPVETSILALDGLNILLTTLDDIREGFEHDIVLAGVLACRYDGRTRLSPLILTELRRALPGKVFETVIRENVRMRECPASGQSIMSFAPTCHAAEDYRALAKEMLVSGDRWRLPAASFAGPAGAGGPEEGFGVEDLRDRASARVREFTRKDSGGSSADQADQTQASEAPRGLAEPAGAVAAPQAASGGVQDRSALTEQPAAAPAETVDLSASTNDGQVDASRPAADQNFDQCGDRLVTAKQYLEREAQEHKSAAEAEESTPTGQEPGQVAPVSCARPADAEPAGEEAPGVDAPAQPTGEQSHGQADAAESEESANDYPALRAMLRQMDEPGPNGETNDTRNPEAGPQPSQRRPFRKKETVDVG